MARAATEQNEDAIFVRGHRVASGIELITAQHRARHAHARRAQPARDEGLPSVHLKIFHGLLKFKVLQYQPCLSAIGYSVKDWAQQVKRPLRRLFGLFTIERAQHSGRRC